MGKRATSSGSSLSDAVFSLSAGGRTVSQDMIFGGLRLDSLAHQLMAAAASAPSDASAAALAQVLSNPACLPDFAGPSGITPLMAAAMRGNDAAVERLASHPLVSLDRQDASGWTALHYAAAFGNEACLGSLLKHRASPIAPANDGRRPIDLAQDGKIQHIFWENAEFRRQIKQHDPARVPPAPASAAGEIAAAAPQPDPLKEAFFNAVTTLSLRQATQSDDARRQMVLKIAELDEEPLRDVYKRIRLTQAEFDWDAVFVIAAYKGNTAALRFLQDELLFDQDTLDLALAASIAGSDQRDAAHHLLIWNANPAAAYTVEGTKGKTIFEAAYGMNRAGGFEEMVTWRGDKLRNADAARFNKEAHGPAMKRALLVHAQGRLLRKLNRRDLARHFNFAVLAGQLDAVMAGYAEAKRGRFLRRDVEITRASGGGAIAVALRHERYEFARLLVADGYRLQDAPEHLKLLLDLSGSAKARQFAADLLSGKMKIPAVRDVGERKRRELRALMVATPRGHYGAF